jgi:hypothetical protein
MRDLYMKSGQGFLLVFSIASRTTFEELETLRDDIIRIKDDEDIPIVIVGNKADLEDQRSVDRAKAFALSQRWNAPYYEASARTRSRCHPRSIDGWCSLLTNPKPTSTSPLSTSAGKCYGGKTSTTTGATTRIRYEQTTRAPNGGAGKSGRKSAPFYEPAFFFFSLWRFLWSAGGLGQPRISYERRTIYGHARHDGYELARRGVSCIHYILALKPFYVVSPELGRPLWQTPTCLFLLTTTPP